MSEKIVGDKVSGPVTAKAVTTDRRMTRTEIAVVGAGPAGMNAAVAAAEMGADVTLIDTYALPGGQYFRQLPPPFKARKTDDRQSQAAALIARLNRPDIKQMRNTRVWAVDDQLRLALQRPDGVQELQAQAVILAAGAYDRPAAFPGWTLPGVMSVGGAQTLVKAQRVLPGRKILVAGSGPLLLALGALLVWAGAEVTAVLEGSPGLTSFKPGRVATLIGQSARLKEGLDYLRTLRGAGVAYRPGWGILRAEGADRVQGAVVARLDRDWRPISGSEQQIPCDTICIGYGFLPQTALSRLAGAQQIYQPQQGGWIPLRDERLQTTVPGLYAAGDGAGIGGAAQSAVEGRIAGMAAAHQVGGDSFKPEDLAKWLSPEWKRLSGEQRFQKLFGELFTPGPGLDDLVQDETVICRCEGVRLTAVREAVQMGAETVGAVKGLTRAGMGDCQGQICGRILAGQVARLCGKDVQEVGFFKVRPPVGELGVASGG